MNSTWHLLIDASGWALVAATVILYIASNKRSAKRDAEQRAEQIKKDAEARAATAAAMQTKMHKENTTKLNELLEERNWLPPHTHDEEHEGKETPLTAGGIRRRPRRNGS